MCTPRGNSVSCPLACHETIYSLSLPVIIHVVYTVHVRNIIWFVFLFIQPYKVYGHNPVLALVNSKSGDNQGVKFLRRLKFWLNPAQVFDLAISGPDLG